MKISKSIHCFINFLIGKNVGLIHINTYVPEHQFSSHMNLRNFSLDTNSSLFIKGLETFNKQMCLTRPTRDRVWRESLQEWGWMETKYKINIPLRGSAVHIKSNVKFIKPINTVLNRAVYYFPLIKTLLLKFKILPVSYICIYPPSIIMTSHSEVFNIYVIKCLGEKIFNDEKYIWKKSYFCHTLGTMQNGSLKSKTGANNMNVNMRELSVPVLLGRHVTCSNHFLF